MEGRGFRTPIPPLDLNFMEPWPDAPTISISPLVFFLDPPFYRYWGTSEKSHKIQLIFRTSDYLP